jgi:hypothetical protein
MARRSSTKPDTPRKATPTQEPWTPWGKAAKARRLRKERRQREHEDRRQQRQHARQRRRTRRRTLTLRGLAFVGLMLAACLVGFVVLLLLGRPYPWEALQAVDKTLALNHELEANRSRWEALAIDHYLIEVEYSDGEGVTCGPGDIEVEDGEVVATPRGTEAHWTPRRTCDAIAERLAVDAAYGWIDESLEDYHPGETRFEVAFDGVFGYPTVAEQGTYGDPTPGCCWRASWRNLRLYTE